jgi:hypothetical protein
MTASSPLLSSVSHHHSGFLSTPAPPRPPPSILSRCHWFAATHSQGNYKGIATTATSVPAQGQGPKADLVDAHQPCVLGCLESVVATFGPPGAWTFAGFELIVPTLCPPYVVARGWPSEGQRLGGSTCWHGSVAYAVAVQGRQIH